MDSHGIGSEYTSTNCTRSVRANGKFDLFASIFCDQSQMLGFFFVNITVGFRNSLNGTDTSTTCASAGLPAYQITIPVSEVFWDPPIVRGVPSYRDIFCHKPTCCHCHSFYCWFIFDSAGSPKCRGVFLMNCSIDQEVVVM